MAQSPIFPIAPNICARRDTNCGESIYGVEIESIGAMELIDSIS